MIQFDDTENESREYAEFIEKFKPKKTPDDCYTPSNIYDVVLSFAVKEYGLEGREVLRPFYPGGDYEHTDYPDGCVVIDNPPFSILSKICAFYDQRGIDYFLFAPGLTLFSTNAGRCNYIVVDVCITYENGAKVNTGFVTNMGRYKIQTRPDLRKALKAANAANTKPEAKPSKYIYPPEVVSAATLGTLARYEFLKIPPEDVVFIRALDAQKKVKKVIYGGGFLLKPKAAAEKVAAAKAAAEEAAVTVWALSDLERAMIEDGSDGAY